MKTFYTFITVLFISVASFAQANDDQKPAFKFVTETINYGKITLGSNGVRVFEFTNTGKSPLINKRVKDEFGVDLKDLGAKLKVPENVSKLHAIIGDALNLPNRKESAL